MTTIEETVRALATRAHTAARALAVLSTTEKNTALNALADHLIADRAAIIEANERDVENAKAGHLKPALIDRLTLTEARFKAMVEGVRHVATLPDPVGVEEDRREMPSGIVIRKVRVPIGVVAIVFESRPNVFIDTAALCLKAGNAVLLRGGKESIETNRALAASVAKVTLPEGAIQLVDILDHAAVTALVRCTGLVDVAIPRGGERLVRAMCEAALVPVLKHYKGICHIYVDDKADLDMALSILDNAKVQRPGVCNAAECLILHRAIVAEFLPRIESWAAEKGVTLHRDEPGVEFLALDLNVAIVNNIDEAIRFINEYGSHHSDAIITNDASHAERFLAEVDSAAVYHNASTRFTDGGEFGMGAEIGISTDKLHARGPMGLQELTTYKYRITGNGTIRR